MNKVDEHIRNCLLKYPSLFSSRWSVLDFIFFTNGNGYVWDKNGCLATLDDTTVTVMKYSDLDQREIDLDKEAEKYTLLGDFHQKYKLEILQERMLRKFREEHIDIFATEDVIRADSEATWEQIKNLDPEWCSLRDIPYDNIDLDWARAIEQTIDKVTNCISKHWKLYDDYRDVPPIPSMKSQMPEKWLTIYDRLREILVLLNNRTGSLDRRNYAISEVLKGLREDVH